VLDRIDAPGINGEQRMSQRERAATRALVRGSVSSTNLATRMRPGVRPEQIGLPGARPMKCLPRSSDEGQPKSLFIPMTPRLQFAFNCFSTPQTPLKVGCGRMRVANTKALATGIYHERAADDSSIE